MAPEQAIGRSDERWSGRDTEAEEGAAEDVSPVAAELLLEDVSIDGMCGVY